MIWLEEKYIHMLAPRLKLFKKVKANQYVFRCPLCGDSKKNAYKTRGGLYVPPSGQNYNMGCFNCGASMSFVNFLKLQDQTLFNQFLIEKYQANNADIKPKDTSSSGDSTQPPKKLSLKDVEPISGLSDDHPAVKYLLKRSIGSEHWDKLYFVRKFKQWEADWRNKPQNKNIPEHSRLIIPFFDKAGNIIRLSARAFFDESPKYIYMKIKDDASRVYGLDRVDAKKRVYVLEGPLDSLFLPNAIATGSADLLVPEIDDFSDVVLIPDNQPRNKEVCRSIKKMVESGKPVCIWNEYWGKDINEMVLAGHSVEQVKELIDESTVSGLAAQMKFASWVKVKLD